MQRFVIFAGLVIGLVAMAGCAGEPKADVRGKVTYHSKPLAFGSVIFMAPGGKSEPVVTEIQPDGTYAANNVPAGETLIGVVSSDPSIKLDLREGQKQPVPKANPKLWFPIPEKYSYPLKSGLSCKLDAGPNTQDIDLK